MIDLTTETPLRLQEAARIAGTGRCGRPVHVSTVLRWIQRGVPAPGGGRIRLAALRVGDHWITTREAFQRWSEAITPRFDNEDEPTPRTPAQRSRAAQRAADDLARAGM